MSLRNQIFFWAWTFVLFFLFLFVFRSILLPFIAGMVLAYLLDPIADKLENLGLSRLASASLIVIVSLILFAIMLVLFIPILVQQFAGFIDRLPVYISQLRALLPQQMEVAFSEFIGSRSKDIDQSFGELLKQGAGWISTLAQSLWNGGQALVDIISLFIVTPVVAFYLLNDWDHIVAKIDSWLPRDHINVIRSLSSQIDRSIAGFMRGQVMVCLFMGCFYALCLSLIGLNFGLLIGFVSGLMSFIPFVGAGAGLIVSVGVAVVQFWPEYIPIILTIGVFSVGQFIEGNILQPKLVGRSVGLHPVWLMFALFAFGALFGFIGMLVAVPLAAVIGVLVRFVLEQYLESTIYLGEKPVDKVNVPTSSD